MKDDLAPVRGIILGCVLGMLLWAAILGIFFG
jgi:hypothetical protein